MTEADMDPTRGTDNPFPGETGLNLTERGPRNEEAALAALNRMYAAPGGKEAPSALSAMMRADAPQGFGFVPEEAHANEVNTREAQAVDRLMPAIQGLLEDKDAGRSLSADRLVAALQQTPGASKEAAIALAQNELGLSPEEIQKIKDANIPEGHVLQDENGAPMPMTTEQRQQMEQEIADDRQRLDDQARDIQGMPEETSEQQKKKEEKVKEFRGDWRMTATKWAGRGGIAIIISLFTAYVLMILAFRMAGGKAARQAS